MGESRKRGWSVPYAKPGQLLARFGRPDRWSDADLCYAWGGRGAESPDGLILSNALENAEVYQGRSLREELIQRGYDITTLRFSIQMKDQPDPSPRSEGRTEP